MAISTSPHKIQAIALYRNGSTKPQVVAAMKNKLSQRTVYRILKAYELGHFEAQEQAA